MASQARNRKNRRDNFSETVLKILCRRAGGKCCKCGVNTIGPVANNPYQTINIGKGAHIAAAAPGGPRYDGRMSPEERSSVQNGLWLCSNCHDQVDKDTHTFTTAKLHEMKRQHEQRVRKEIGILSRPVSQSNQSDVIIGISSATILDIRKTKFHFLESMTGRGNPTHHASAALSHLGYIDVEEDEYCEEVAWELLLLFHQLVSHSRDPKVNLEVIRRIKSIVDLFHGQLDRGRVQLVCDLVKMILSDVSLSRRSSVYLSGMALLKDFVLTLKAGSQGLHNLPQQVMRNLRSMDHVDSGLADESPTKKMRQEEEAEPVGEGEELEYTRLMDQLLETDDPEKILDIEQKMIDLGYPPFIH